MAQTKTESRRECDSYMGIPMPEELKKEIQRMAGENVPKVKPSQMARSILAQAVQKAKAKSNGR